MDTNDALKEEMKKQAAFLTAQISLSLDRIAYLSDAQARLEKRMSTLIFECAMIFLVIVVFFGALFLSDFLTLGPQESTATQTSESGSVIWQPIYTINNTPVIKIMDGVNVCYVDFGGGMQCSFKATSTPASMDK